MALDASEATSGPPRKVVDAAREHHVRCCIARIGPRPCFSCFSRLLHVACDENLIVRRDKEFFPITGSITQFPSSPNALGRQVGLIHIGVDPSERGVRHSELRIEFHGALEKGESVRRTFGRMNFPSRRKRLQRLQRACGRFGEGNIVFDQRLGDSPTRDLNRCAIPLRAPSTSSFRSTWICSFSTRAPELQLVARNASTYWVPMLVIEPSTTRRLPVRWQTPREVEIQPRFRRPPHQA